MMTDTLKTNPDDLEAVHRCEHAYNRVRDELAKVIVGQDEVIEQVLIAVFARGHALLEGVPGLAKTLLVSSLARALDLTFKRIQFTPDLMPSDVTGTEIIQENVENGRREYRFLPGPLFANLLLADEINRTPPKTQAAMLEAMQERQVSAGGTVHRLPNPFFVLATQNPLEQEGTYPLPEAQLDRFLLHIRVDYPSGMEEWEIARRVTGTTPAAIQPVLTGDEIIELQQPRDSGAGLRSGAGIRLDPGSFDPAGNAGIPRLHQQMGTVGGRSPRAAHAVDCREGAGGPLRPLPRHRRRRARRREAGVASPAGE